jgi:hypothetical protein
MVKLSIVEPWAFSRQRKVQAIRRSERCIVEVLYYTGSISQLQLSEYTSDPQLLIFIGYGRM